MSRISFFLGITLLILFLAACRQRMAEQPSHRPFSPAKFFEDGRSARPLVKGTVPRGFLRADPHFYRGELQYTIGRKRLTAIVGSAGSSPLLSAAIAVSATNVVDTLPLKTIVRKLHVRATTEKEQLLAVYQRGRQRFNIYCAVCHDRAGTGAGMIAQRGYAKPPSYHLARIRQKSLGHYFKVIADGYGAMPSLSQQIPPEDRWAIVAYVRVLQESQHALAKELPAELQNQLTKGDAPK